MPTEIVDDPACSDTSCIADACIVGRSNTTSRTGRRDHEGPQRAFPLVVSPFFPVGRPFPAAISKGEAAPNVRRITHFISFSGEHLPATAQNYAADAVRYVPVVHQMIAKGSLSVTEHDRNAYAYQAGLHARIAAHSGRRALEIAESQKIKLTSAPSAS